MRVLIVKTSSLGDVLHTLPALSDAARALPGVRFDWLVEEAFAEIPAWHAAVDKVIRVALRRWRKRPVQTLLNGEAVGFVKNLRVGHYDAIIDAQGLIKSAVLTRLARGQRHGLGRSSAREPWSAFSYDQSHAIAWGQHAIDRVRQLFAAALDYPVPPGEPDFGITRERFAPGARVLDDIIFLHGTTWPSKQWPQTYWVALARLTNAAGFRVSLPWGNTAEFEFAQTIVASAGNARLLPRMRLTELATHIAQARAVVGVDTGLAHLAAALSVPSVTIYGATQPALTGTRGQAQIHVSAAFSCSPCLQRHCHYHGPAEVQPACYQTVSPQRVWDELVRLL